MKKKLTDEEIGQAIGNLAKEIKRQLKYDCDVAYRDMCWAENCLANSLNENQRQLYQAFREKRDAFFEIASEVYKERT